jgi:hypothetical protein
MDRWAEIADILIAEANDHEAWLASLKEWADSHCFHIEGDTVEVPIGFDDDGFPIMMRIKFRRPGTHINEPTTIHMFGKKLTVSQVKKLVGAKHHDR